MARSAEAVVYDSIRDNNWRQLELWLRALPKSVTSRPLLIVAEAYLQHFLSNFSAVPTDIGYRSGQSCRRVLWVLKR